MTLTARDIIKSGFRKLGALASGDDPTAEEINDAFPALVTMLRALHGDVIGQRLSAQPLTGATQADNGALYQCSLSAGVTLTAPLKPRSGSRFGVVDVKANFATNNLTVAPNGQLLEAASANLVLSTNGTQRIWFFDGDTGNWVREADLANVDTSPPYPDRLIAFLPFMFALFMAPEFDAEIRPDITAAANLGMQSFARTYSRRGVNQLDPPVGVSLAPGGH